jgi:hypothetical protein
MVDLERFVPNPASAFEIVPHSDPALYLTCDETKYKNEMGFCNTFYGILYLHYLVRYVPVS